MRIHGISKLTLLDYPGHTACTLFTGGCNFRCPFCQNGSLVLSPDGEPVIDEGWLLDFLKRRRNVLQGVCITGGEPTLNRDLDIFIRKLRELGYKIKLDTNGYLPDVLADLLDAGLLDAVAMDIKSSPEGYARAAGLETSASDARHFEGSHARAAGLSTGGFDFGRIERSAQMLRIYAQEHPDFYCEYRTTVVRELHTPQDMTGIGEWLAGAPHYFLQRYEDSEYVIGSGLGAFSTEEMQELADAVRPYIPGVQLRGV